MDYKLSVIIPVYNVEEYLAQCIESILAQKYTFYELILVDDGSTDGSGIICDEYANQNEHIKVIHQKNLGHTAARQRGFQASEGKYIIMIDSDDWIEPDMFQRLMKITVNDDIDIVQCNFRSVKDGVGKDKVPLFAEGLYDKQQMEKVIYPRLIYGCTADFFGIVPNMWNKIFRRELVEKYLFKIDKRIKSGEDGLFTYACFLDASKIWIINACYYNYRSREVSMCRIIDDKRLDQNHILFEYYKDWFYNKPILKKQIEHYVVWQTLQAMEELIKVKKIGELKKRYGYLKEECLERWSIQNVKLSEIQGKKNRMILAGLKLWK